ncbi:MAG: hypothetical protein K2O40_14940 [Lachnospiraceae bacterium]|nr:hypothetical protein [Lachnospiraceae bacterium]
MKSTFKFALCLFCLFMTVTGCSHTSPALEKEPIENTAFLAVGRHLEINNTNDSLILYDYKEALAGDGLYYASWRIGDAVPYENSEGDTVDLYDAQLYLLLGEFTSSINAQSSMDEWLEKAESNYEISAEEEIVCNEQAYRMITYTFPNETNPYARGVSAFGVYENSVVCIELTCQKDFAGDLKAIITGFLENCTYIK